MLALEDIVRPFVFRKYLDYGAIASLRELHALIRAETGRRNAGRDDRGDNVKLGRGGIREIEFLAQTFQIIRGGREPRLRSRSTLATLACLAELGSLPQDTAHAARGLLRVPAQPRTRAAVRRRCADPHAAGRTRGARNASRAAHGRKRALEALSRALHGRA